MPKCKECESEKIELVLEILGEGKLYQCKECKTIFVKNE